jgi:hypothetical protein
MAWTKLATRLKDLPMILSGPILRRVTPTSVTVWLALRERATVKLLVYNGNDKVMEATRETTGVGTNLHIVAVTASDSTSLAEGIVYTYDLVFTRGTLSQMLSIAAEGKDFKPVLVYPPLKLPSFALPPKDLQKVRLIHGSCRKPHGPGFDTFSILDDLIKQTAANAMDRPHQLLLTGDQIYADDVADILLLMLTDAGETLLGWSEVLPVPKANGGPLKATELSSHLRNSVLEATGFTTEDLKSHVLSLSEYLAMYLFVWSDVLWPASASPLPTFADVWEWLKSNVDSRVAKRWEAFLNTKEDGINAERNNVEELRKRLPSVRRALANIPSYMIFDDHEITDDWNMTRKFCKSVYGSEFGRRVIQNGLVAYALCQLWGNTPEQFEDSGQQPAGLKLLRLLEASTATTYDQNSASLGKIVGVHDEATLKARPDRGLFHDQTNWITVSGKRVSKDSLVYNFTVEAPGYQLIVTDTRSWRSFPTGLDRLLLSKDQFKAQILDSPPLGDRLLLVILSTNAPPVQPIRQAEQHPTLAGKNADIYESWLLPSVGFDRLLARLSDKFAKDATGTQRGRVLVLSGDVHHSFASRLIYRAKTRFEDQQAQPAVIVMGQLVSSALKNQNGNTLGLHREGYTFAPKVAKWKIPAHQPEGYLGWNVPAGSGKVVGRMIAAAGGTVGWADLKLDDPTISLVIGVAPFIVELSQAPDYRYRLDYLVASKQGTLPKTPPTIPPLPAGATDAQRKNAAKAFHAATGNYRDYNNGAASTREVVGRNNIGEITFEWGAGDHKQVNHTLRWWDGVASTVQWTTYTVSLDPNDTNFADIKAAKEP